MPIFKVQRIVDAAMIYEADVEAETAEQASEKAQAAEQDYQWGEGDLVEYDARRFTTLDERGMELEHTSRGDW